MHGLAGAAWGGSAKQPSCCRCRGPPSAGTPCSPYPEASGASPSAAAQLTAAASHNESPGGSGQPNACQQSAGRSGQTGLCSYWQQLLEGSEIFTLHRTYFIVWFQMHHQLLKSCMIVMAEHNASSWREVSVRLLHFIIFTLCQTVTVGLVLRVNEQLHLELSSQHGLSWGLLFLLNAFNLSLEKKPQIYRHLHIDVQNILLTKGTTETWATLNKYLGSFQKVRKSCKAKLSQLYEHLLDSI